MADARRIRSLNMGYSEVTVIIWIVPQYRS